MINPAGKEDEMMAEMVNGKEASTLASINANIIDTSGGAALVQPIDITQDVTGATMEQI